MALAAPKQGHEGGPPAPPALASIAARRGLALLGFAAVALAGCGGDGLSQDEYTTEVREVLAPVVERSTELNAEGQAAKSIEEFAATLGEAQALYDETTAALEGLEPPEDVADLHGRLTTSNREIAGAMADAQEAAESEMPDQVEEILGDANQAYQTELAALADEFSAEGYDFGAQ